jgi:hypothetical protein
VIGVAVAENVREFMEASAQQNFVVSPVISQDDFSCAVSAQTHATGISGKMRNNFHLPITQAEQRE